MGQHHARADAGDMTGPIPIAVLLKASQKDSQPIHPDHLPDVVSEAEEPAPVVSWAADLLERALRTGIQSGVAWLGTAQAAGQPLNQGLMFAVLVVIGASMVLSILTALVSAPSFNNSWWFQVLERAVKTFAQNVLAGWGVMEVAGPYLGGFPLDFPTVLSSAAVAAVTSAVMSVVTTNMGNTDTVDISSPKG